MGDGGVSSPTVPVRGHEQITRAQNARGLRGGFVRAVDERHVRPEQLGQQRLEEWVMGAAQNEGIDPRGFHRGEVLARNESRRLGVEPSLFNQWHEQRTGARHDVRVRRYFLDRALVCTRPDGARRADDAQLPATRRGDRGPCSRLDDADDRQRKLTLQGRQGMRGGRVAGHDDGFDVLRLQELSDLAAVASDGVGAFRSVWNPSRVTEVDDPLVRELQNELANDCETADPGVEDADW